MTDHHRMLMDAAAGDPGELNEAAALLSRPCPGLPGHPPGPCLWPPEPGDRYCAGCRAEFDAMPQDGGW